MSEFNSYLTYTEYVELGGTLEETVFTPLEREAQRYLDYYTFDRLKVFIDNTIPIPDEVKDVIMMYINKLHEYNTQNSDNGKLSHYSNGVETIEYANVSEEQLHTSMLSIASKWLPLYLVCREVRFDIKKYLQSKSHIIQ